MYNLERFARSQWRLVVCQDGRIIFKSRASALGALRRYLKTGGKERQGVEIFDKYVGRAAGLLMVLARPLKVYTPIMSDGGVEVFERYDIDYNAIERVPWLKGLASEGICQWERMAIGKTAEEFYAELEG